MAKKEKAAGKKYKVLKHIRHGEADYAPGSEITIESQALADLLISWGDIEAPDAVVFAPSEEPVVDVSTDG